MDLFSSFKKFTDKQMNTLVERLVQNEHFIKAVERIFTTKEFLDRNSEVIYNGLNLASRVKTREISDRVDQLDRQVHRLSKQAELAGSRHEELAAQVEGLREQVAGLDKPQVESVRATVPQTTPTETEPEETPAERTYGEAECKVCGKTFAKRAPRQIFCSQECREAKTPDQDSQEEE
jgi:polyhydroxyalkanoate synthesis regulator phasin